MKLATDLKPRRDGSVLAEVGSAAYKFERDADGRFVADIESAADIAFLLDTGNFHPADESDINALLDNGADVHKPRTPRKPKAE